MSDREWLDGLKEGDSVAVVAPRLWGRVRGNGYITIEKIERVTKTLFIIGDNRIRKDDGFEPGTGRKAHIEQITEKVREQVKRQKLISFCKAAISRVNWEELEMRHLESLSNTLSKVRK